MQRQQQPEIDLPSDHSSRFEWLEGAAVEALEPAPDHALNAAGQNAVGQASFSDLVETACALGEHPDDFDHEERDSLALGREQSSNALAMRRWSDHGGPQLCHFLRRETAQLEMG